MEEGLGEKIKVKTKDEAVAALQAGDRPKPGSDSSRRDAGTVT